MPARRDSTATMTKLLREALADAESLRAIETTTGIHRASLRRFRDGQTSLRLDIADRLAEHFGIECQRRKRKG